MSAAQGVTRDRRGRNGGPSALLVLSEAVFRRLMVAFPADFRRHHGRDAVELFRDRYREARRGGAWRLVAFWGRNLIDVIGQGLSERRATRAAMPSPGGGPGRPARRRRLGFERGLQSGRLAARNLARSPVYSLVVIAVFALTIMAVTTVFSAMESLLWRPLPFREPDRLMFIGETSAGSEGPGHVTSLYALDAVRREVSTLQGLTFYNIWEATLTGAGEPKRLGGAVATWNYFDTLGVAPQLGRAFNQDDGVPGGDPIVAISDRLWRGRFGADPAVIGRLIELNGVSHEVVSVMPAGLETPDQYTFTRVAPDVWRPYRLDFDDAETVGEPGRNYLRAVARLAPGADIGAVDAQLEALRLRIGEEYPRWAEGARIKVLPLQYQFTYQMRPVLWILTGAVGLVLLVGSVNLMNLIFSRTIDRGHEFAVRAALGAGRAHLLGHGVVEALLLAIPGGIIGVVLARWSIRALLAASPEGVPRIDAVALRPLSAAAAMALTLAAALLAGLVPGLRLLRRDAGGDLGLQSRESSGAAGGLAHSTLAVVQLALAVTLLVAAGLLMRSFRELLRVDPGFDPTGVYVAQLDLPPGRYEDIGARTLLTDDLASRLEALSDVAAVGFVTTVPQHGYNNFSTGFGIAGRESDPDAPTWAFFRGASPGYFDAIGIRLQRGRLLQAQDFKDGVPTAVLINEEAERRYFDGGSALGATLEVLGQADLQVVGIVSNVQYGSFGEEPAPETYVPWQGRLFTIFLVVRSASPGADVAGLMKHEVQAFDPYLPMDDVWSLEDLTADTLAETRLPMLLMAMLAGFAVILSAMGTYGVIAHMVACRTAEIGIRMALGARVRTVLRLVLGRVLRIAVVGSVVGLGLAWVAARSLESLLFGVGAHDPVTFALVTAFLVAVSLAACLQPARRAARVDPVIALRGN